MASVTYAIVFKGEIREGFQAVSVKTHVAKLLKADARKTQVLFSGKPVVIKRTTDKAVAVKWGTALKKVGANVQVKIVKAEALAVTASKSAVSKPAASKQAVSNPAALKQAASKQAASKPGVSKPATAQRAVFKTAFETDSDKTLDSIAPSAGDEFTLAPNVGNLFEPKPEVATPRLNLSEYSVSENDGTPLIEPTVYESAKIDLSEFSVAENDGAPLVEAAPEVAKVEAPDFGLDAPGAVLETLKEAVELLNPDTSSMSLAFPGTDLLNEDEKKGPSPKGPDTSKISLVPDIDL